jgi:hypothetical protein
MSVKRFGPVRFSMKGGYGAVPCVNERLGRHDLSVANIECALKQISCVPVPRILTYFALNDVLTTGYTSVPEPFRRHDPPMEARPQLCQVLRRSHTPAIPNMSKSLTTILLLLTFQAGSFEWPAQVQHCCLVTIPFSVPALDCAYTMGHFHAPLRLPIAIGPGHDYGDPKEMLQSS